MNLLALVVALAAAQAPAPAGGVLVSFKGPVRVERGAAKPAAELGMRLMKGDVVVVGTGGSAMLYLAGGGIERVPAGGKFEVPAQSGASTKGSMKSSESGLWVLNDPSGSILVAAMRGNDGAFADANATRADLLSPRYETVADRHPRFYATGGTRPLKIAVGMGKDVVWRSGPLDGAGPWSPEGFPDLDAAKVYLWRIESSEGEPQSEWVPFRVPSSADADAAAAFEKEMASLSASPDGTAAADVLRCGRYLDTSSWTPLLSAATRLLALQPDSTVAKRARESAVRGLRLEAERSETLVRLLSL